MLDQRASGTEIFRAVLLDCTDADNQWRPSRERAEHDARAWTQDDAVCAYIQVGWIPAEDPQNVNERGFLLLGDEAVDEGGLIPVPGWLDDEDRRVLNVLWGLELEMDLDYDRIETVREALLRDAVKRTAP